MTLGLPTSSSRLGSTRRGASGKCRAFAAVWAYDEKNRYGNEWGLVEPYKFLKTVKTRAFKIRTFEASAPPPTDYDNGRGALLEVRTNGKCKNVRAKLIRREYQDTEW